jgi:hypothetical protein
MAPITLSTVDSQFLRPLTLLLRSMVLWLTLTPTDEIKDIIQHLFEIQSAVHGYLGPETQQELVRKMYLALLIPLPSLFKGVLYLTRETNLQQKPHSIPPHPLNPHKRRSLLNRPLKPSFHLYKQCQRQHQPLRPTDNIHCAPAGDNRLRGRGAQPGHLHA